MFVPAVKHSNNRRRIIGAAVVLVVFFLPLHFHFSSGAKVAQDCACVQGTRTQLAPIAAVLPCAPSFAVQPFIAQAVILSFSAWLRLRSVRAPPVSLSL
jgi:hypothetical protein